LGGAALKVGVVDIGTNSMRLLITSPGGEIGRWVRVTGLGRGVDKTGVLSDDGMERSMAAFAEFGHHLDTEQVGVRKAIATSASRDATNREEFFDQVETAIGVRPTLISGDDEARYAFRGAVGDTGDGTLVSDIGGGSTEFVSASDSISVDIGSVRLTDRILGTHPISRSRLENARSHVRELFAGVAFQPVEVIGVAGTWTSLSAITLKLDEYDPEVVHGSVVSRADLSTAVDYLAAMSLPDVEKIPSLDRKRAPVIVAGAIVAEQVLSHLGVDRAKISERDTLDGVAEELLALL
jgi:exopolyphosphatase/guanosine-5'-triphosphate,3'-diphosphate pyrophosphatase